MDLADRMILLVMMIGLFGLSLVNVYEINRVKADLEEVKREINTHRNGQ